MAKFCNHCEKSVETKTDRESGRLLCAECGAVLGYAAAALPRGTVIAGYRIEDPIGQGGMGVVYRATQINLERPAALKILSDELSDEPGFVESFFHEARVAANLTHPNIVQAYAAGTTKEGINYFAMELVEGESLDIKLKRTGPLAPIPAMHVALQLAKALEYAWNTKKMCHGDIKPDNILITHDGTIKLADLGLARSIHEESAKRDVMVTPLYAAPELISGKQTSVSLRSDMYSYGAALYHIVVGRPPFESGKVEDIYRRHLTEQPVPPIEVNAEIPVGISQLIMRLLAKAPEDRPEDWTEVISIISHILDAYENDAPFENESRRTLSIPFVLMFCGVAIVLLAFLALIVFHFAGKRKPVPPEPEQPAAVEILAPAKTEPSKPEPSGEELRTRWLRWKESVQTAPLQVRSAACARFLREHQPPDPLRTEIMTELDRLNREIESLNRQTAVYREAVDVFLSSSFGIPLEGREVLADRIRLYRMLVRQGRLPHLAAEYRKNRRALSSVRRQIELRLRKLDELGELPYESRKRLSAPPAPRKVSPKAVRSRRIEPEQEPPKVADSQKSVEELNREFRDLLHPHIRRFSPDILRSQMAGFARRYASRNCLAVRKARAIADNLGDTVFMARFHEALDDLREVPLSRFGKNATLTGVERGSIRVTFNDGRITLRQRIGLMPENIALLRSSILDVYRDPVWRKRLKPDFQYFLCLASIFYDTPNSLENVREYRLNQDRKALMEDILRDLSALSSAKQ